MRIQNSAVNIVFDRNDNIKKKYISNEEILKPQFNEASILPIPDDAPAEIPRIIVQSKKEHSQLSIAPEAINFHTTYTDEYTNDWGLCEQYISEHIKNVFELTNRFAINGYKYMGIIADILWDEVRNEGNRILFKNIFGKLPSDNLDDLEIKYTYIEDEKYYVNITLKSVRIYNEFDTSLAGQYTDENLQTHTINIVLDINDRYMFNKTEAYKSQEAYFDKLMKVVTDVIANKLKALVEKGEF